MSSSGGAAARSSNKSNSTSHHGKVHLPTSIRQRVLESWQLVENDLDTLGMDFFMTIFTKHAHLKALFQFGGIATQDLRESKLLQAHANGVMKTVGVALAGLEDMESLIPVLRNLGRIHSLVGVQPSDYDLIYTVLIDTIKAHVGPDKWTVQIQQAWELCYMVITSVMKDPGRHLEVEPAEGWGLWCAGVCAYWAVITPLQLAGFGVGQHNDYYWHVLFGVGNALALATCVLDYCSDVLQQFVSLKAAAALGGSHNKKPKQSTSRLWFAIKFKLNRLINRLRLSRWVPWKQLDLAIITSFAIQAMLPESAAVPLVLKYIIGLVPLASLSRLVHFLKCAELVSLKRPDVNVEHFHYAQLIQLLVALVYMIHLFGCLHCMVALLEENGESGFSPSLPNILEQGHMFNAYLHAAYWAFVNVAGIGNYDSAPETSFQILFTMVVHLVGATFYAIAAGNIFAILEARAEQFNQVSEGVASLKEFMQQCDIPEPSQDKFLSGYLMHNLVATKELEGQTVESVTSSRPLVPSSASTLPVHLNLELTLFSRAKAIRARGIPSASVEFSFVLAESLVDSLTLLAGDYLFQQSASSISEHKMSHACRVWMVDQGTLEVFGLDGVSKHILYPGDVIGLGWLALRRGEEDVKGEKNNNNNSRKDSTAMSEYKASVDFMTSFGKKGHATADMRAMADCKLVSGLASSRQVQDLWHMHPSDMKRIQDIVEGDFWNQVHGADQTEDEDAAELTPSETSTVTSEGSNPLQKLFSFRKGNSNRRKVQA